MALKELVEAKKAALKARPTAPYPAPARGEVAAPHGAAVPPFAARAPPLEVLRFADLVSMGVVKTWPTLTDWIERRGFPRGFLIGPNSRAWMAADVYGWLASRPVAPKEVLITDQHISRNPSRRRKRA
jgi:predicted DNA-binding transcriptional regulator AlpA